MSFGVGLVVAWFVVSQAWVMFDSIVPMWASTAFTAATAVATALWRRRAVGLSAGLMFSAVMCGTVFTLLSSGPGID